MISRSRQLAPARGANDTPASKSNTYSLDREDDDENRYPGIRGERHHAVIVNFLGVFLGSLPVWDVDTLYYRTVRYHIMHHVWDMQVETRVFTLMRLSGLRAPLISSPSKLGSVAHSMMISRTLGIKFLNILKRSKVAFCNKFVFF